MSAIDSFRHTLLGLICCPSRFPIAHGNDTTRLVAIYRLDEDAPDEASFEGASGDILLGGGSGEAAALRIALPETFYYFTHDDRGRLPGSAASSARTPIRPFWSVTQAYVFGDGYATLGWAPDTPLEFWLAHHVLSFLVRQYPAEYAGYLGTVPLEQDGSICRPSE